MTESRRRPGPTEKLLLEFAGGLAVYFGVFVVGPALMDSTSELRLKVAEARDAFVRVRERAREIRSFRSDIDAWGKDGDNERLA